MPKRIFTLIVALIMTVLPLSACFDGEPERTGAPEVTKGIPEEPVLRSFYSGEVLYSYDQSDNFYLTTQEGTEEYEKWERIYVDPDANSDVLIYYEEGELYEIFYSGEITPMADTQYGYIEKLHTIRILNSPRESDGIVYSVAALRQDFNMNKISSVSLNAQGKADGNLMLLAESREEFTEMANKYFMFEREIPENATELQRKTITQMNQRRQLLDGYDESFFENNDLLMLFVESGSGSSRYDIPNIISQDGVLTINIAMTRGYLTDDMACWVFFVSIPKNITALTHEYKNTYTNLDLQYTAQQYGYISGEFKYKALNYTGEDQDHYTPWLFKAESEDELKAIFELIRNPSGINAFDDGDDEKAYDSLFGQIGKGFFESNALIVIYRAAGSGGDAFAVSSVTIAGNTMTIGISQTEYGATNDMSGWLFRIAVPKSAVEGITEYIAE